MQHQSHAFSDPIPAGIAADYARLRDLLSRIGGRHGHSREDALDELARISSAYDQAPAIVRRRFDTLAADAACWAETGVEALNGGSSSAAAECLRTELRDALSELGALLRV